MKKGNYKFRFLYSKGNQLAKDLICVLKNPKDFSVKPRTEVKQSFEFKLGSDESTIRIDTENHIQYEGNTFNCNKVLCEKIIKIAEEKIKSDIEIPNTKENKIVGHLINRIKNNGDQKLSIKYKKDKSCLIYSIDISDIKLKSIISYVKSEVKYYVRVNETNINCHPILSAEMFQLINNLHQGIVENKYTKTIEKLEGKVDQVIPEK